MALTINLDGLTAKQLARAQNFEQKVEAGQKVSFKAGSQKLSYKPSAGAETVSFTKGGATFTTFSAATTAAPAPTPAATPAPTPAPAAGTSFTLTTGVDNLTGGSGNDTFVGFADGTTSTTFGIADSVNGGAGQDTFAITLGADLNATGIVTGIEAVTVRAAGAARTINLGDFSGVTSVSATASGNVLTINGGDVASTYSLSDTDGGGLNVTLRASQLAGTADAVKFSVGGTGSSFGAAGVAPTTLTTALTSAATGVETIQVVTSGTNIFSVTDATTPGLTDYTKFQLTGNGANTVDVRNLGQLTSIDLAGATGSNSVRIGGALQTGTTVTGGTGSDTLRVAPTTTVANLTATAVETLRLNDGSNTGTLVFATAPSFTTVRLDGDTAETGTYTLTNMGNAVTGIQYRGEGLTATSATGQQFNNLTFVNSFTGASDAVSVAVSNAGITNAGGNTLRTLTVGGVESLTVNVADAAATATSTFTGINANALTSLRVTAASNVALGDVSAQTAAGTSGSIGLIDLTGLTGSGTSSISIANNSIGTATVINSANSAATRVDVTIAGAETAGDSVIFTGGVGVDVLAVTSGAFAGTIVADGKAGNDTLAGGGGADVLTGGEGADSITGNTGADTIVLSESVAVSDTVVFAANTVATTDSISGFAGGTAGDILSLSVTQNTAVAAVNRITNGNDGVVAAGAAVVQVVTAAATLGTTTNVIVLSGTFADDATMLAAIGGGTRALTSAAANPTDNADYVVVYSNGTNAFVKIVNDSDATGGGAAAFAAADLSVVATVATLTGVTDVAGYVSANFSFIA